MWDLSTIVGQWQRPPFTLCRRCRRAVTVAARQGLVCSDPGVFLPGSKQTNKNPLRVLRAFAVQYFLCPLIVNIQYSIPMGPPLHQILLFIRCWKLGVRCWAFICIIASPINTLICQSDILRLNWEKAFKFMFILKRRTGWSCRML